LVFRRILCPADGSDASLRGVYVATEIAKRYEAELVLLTVINVPQTVAVATHMEVCRYVEKVGGECTRNAVRLLEQSGLGAEVKLACGSPVEVILFELQHSQCDIVVMGRRHWAEAKDLVLGSVSERVTRHVNVPILLIP
jgi:nucleotide-binding universal stress UspA family protein